MKTTQLTAIVLALGITLSARAATIFSEDFESYAPGSNLNGQGGWTEGGASGSSVLTITNGTYLPSLVVNGRVASGLGIDNYVDHPIPIDPTSTTTLHFSAYAVSATPRTDDQYVGMNANSVEGPFWIANYPSGGPPRWRFGLGATSLVVTGGYDRIVEMGVVIDGAAKETYGTYDFGSGISETPHLRMTDEQLTNVSGIRIYVDKRPGFGGMEIDSIRVDSVSSLSIQPQRQVVTAGSTATFSVSGGGAPPYTFQWWFNGIPLPGANGTNLILTNVTVEHAGNYSVIVSNALGVVTSTAMLQLSVGANATFVQPLTAWPNGTNSIEWAVAFTGDANGNGYSLFEISPNLTGPFQPVSSLPYVPGPPAWRSYAVGDLLTATDYYVRATHFDADGVVGTNPQVIGPIRTLTNAPNTARLGTNLVVVSDTEIFVHQTILDDANHNAGATTEVATNATGPWVFKCGSSKARVRSLLPGTDYWVRVTITDEDGIVGTNAQLIGPIHYTGLRNLALGKPISADPGWGCCPNPSELVDGVVQNDDWDYGFAWCGGLCNCGGCGPGWKQATIDFGTPTTFNRAMVWHHSPADIPVLWSFQYSEDGVIWTDSYVNVEPRCRTEAEKFLIYAGYPSSGFDAAFLPVTARYFRYTFDDRTIFDATHGWAHEIEVFYDDRPPAIARPVQSQMATVGRNVALAVEASGSLPLAYQWHFNGTPLVAATNSVYVVANAQSTNVGYYSVVVNNAFGAVTSTVATLTVTLDAAYVANFDDDTVSVISRSTLEVLATLRVGDQPVRVAATPDGRRVFVANRGSDNVSVIDTASGTVIATIPVGDAPNGLATTTDSQRVFVSNTGSASISVIDVGANLVLTNVATPLEPSAIACHPVRNELWVAYDTGTPGIEVRSTTDFSILASLAGSSRFYGGGLSFRADGSECISVEVCGCCGRFHRVSGNHDSGMISIIEADIFDNNTGKALAATIHPGTSRIFLGKTGHCDAQPGPRVYEFGTGRSLALTSVPNAMAVDPAADRLWVALGEGKVAVIDTLSLTATGTVVVGVQPQGIALAPFPAPPPAPPSISVQPHNQTVTPGASVILSVGAAGTPPLSYQWVLNVTLIVGATHSSHLVSNAQFTDTGGYSVVVSNPFGSVTSQVAVLTVLQSAPFALQGAVYFGGPGDQSGTALSVFDQALYVAGLTTSNGWDGLISRYALPLTAGASPVWSKVWPSLSDQDYFYGVAASASGVYAASWSDSRTVDTEGGKETKGLVIKFPLIGTGGTGYGGALWDRQTPAPPGAFSYGGGEGLAAVIVVPENGTNCVYATGHAQSGSSYNSGRFYLSKLSEDSTVLWTRKDGTGGEVPNSFGNALAAHNGHIYVAGFSAAGGMDRPCLWKYAPNGSLAWQRFSTTGSFYRGVAVFENAIYGVGATAWNGTNADFLIEKWDESGTRQWSRVYDRNADEDVLNGIVGLGRDLYAVGSTRGSTAGGADAVLLRLDAATGDLLGESLHGGALDDLANGIATDGQDLYVVGETRSFGTGSNDLMVLRYSPVSYPLTDLTPGGGTVSWDPPGGLYLANTAVTLTATPAPGWTFLRWEGDAQGTGNPTTVRLDGSRQVKAVFGHPLTVWIAGEAGDSVLNSPAETLYAYGSEVRLSARPGPNRLFLGWGSGGSIQTAENPFLFRVDESRTEVTAYFARQSTPGFLLNLAVVGQGAVLRDPALAVYPTNSLLTLTAVPDPGHLFVEWQGAVSGRQNPVLIMMDNNQEVTAFFAPSNPPVVTLIAPTNNSVFVGPTNVILTAIATDDEAVVSVEFFNGTNSLGWGTSTHDRFTLVLTNALPGSNVFMAKARDNRDLVGISPAVTNVIRAAPHFPVFSFLQGAYEINEQFPSVPIYIRKDGTDPASVRVFTVPITAIPTNNGVGDYVPLDVVLHFGPGSSQTNLSLWLADDDLYEGRETFAVQLEASTNAVVGSPGTLIIGLWDSDVGSGYFSVTNTRPPDPSLPPTGRLQVWLEPTSAVGQWRFSWEATWHSPTSVVSNLVPGNFAVEFRPRSGFRTPEPMIVVVADGLTTVTNTYFVSGAIRRGSLTVTLPAAPDGARWRLVGETGWLSSGQILTDLDVGDYVVEFRALENYAAPPRMLVTVFAGLQTASIASYLSAPALPASIVRPSEVAFAAILETNLANPYACVGQVRSDVGWGSGCAVRERVVLTAAHVLFDHTTLAFAGNVLWFPQRHADFCEPQPLQPRLIQLLAGYAAQIRHEATNASYRPAQSSSEASEQDVGVMMFYRPAARGGFAGYLVSEAESDWLINASPKMLVGYPVDTTAYGVTNLTPHRMHATPPSTNYLFANFWQHLYHGNGFIGFPGNSGGPVLVQAFSNQVWYPAAVYLGAMVVENSLRPRVRVIDSEVADLISRAAEKANQGDDQTGGGVPVPPPGSLAGSELRKLTVLLGPPEALMAGAAWRVSELDNEGGHWMNLASNMVDIGTEGNYTVVFVDLPNFDAPQSWSVTFAPDQHANDLILTANYVPTNAPVLLTNPSNCQVRLGEYVELSVVASSSVPLFYQWQRNGTNLVGRTSNVLPLSLQPPQPSENGGPWLTGMEGPYQVIVSNRHGRVTSTSASVAILLPEPLQLQFTHSQLLLRGPTGYVWRVESAPALSEPMAWRFWRNIPLTNSPQLLEIQPWTNDPQRFFRIP